MAAHEDDLAVSPRQLLSCATSSSSSGPQRKSGPGPARDALLRRGSAILDMPGGSTLGETQQNLMQIFSVGAPARASEGPHHQSY